MLFLIRTIQLATFFFSPPAHEAGLVCLQVLESGGSVSSSVLFEYRARNASSLPSSQLDWLSLDGQLSPLMLALKIQTDSKGALTLMPVYHTQACTPPLRILWLVRVHVQLPCYSW